MTHIDRVTCYNFGFPLAERITIFAPLELFSISCSSSRLSLEVPRFTKSGINRGCSPCLVLVPFCCRPRNTCGSLSSRGRVEAFDAGGFAEEKSVDPRARRDSSSEPALFNFLQNFF